MWRAPLACCNGLPSGAFAGFTVAPGPMNGRPGMHLACDTEFAGSHMCHAAEYLGTVSTAAPPAGGAWLDSSVTPRGFQTEGGAPSFGRWVGTSGTCRYWASTSTSYAGLVLSSSGELDYDVSCDTPRPVACCF